MSFYGNIKRVNSSPFVFDRYFPNRFDMEEKLKAGDGVYVGRYVLIRYDCAYKKEGATSVDELDFFTRWKTDGAEHEKFVENYNKDLDKYHDTFNGTVWQKIYTTVNDSNVPQEKYIMVAELNADAPGLRLEVISPMKINDAGQEEWNQPEFMKDGQSEEVFKVAMPDVLHLSVDNSDAAFYGGEDLLNPSKRGSLPAGVTDPFSKDYNYATWKNITYNKDENGVVISKKESEPGDNVDEKQLDMKLYGFGQAISNMYDVLYGIPDENDSNQLRPFFTDKEITTPGNKGLVGILTSIGAEAKGDLTQDTYARSMNSAMHYYFISKWRSADEDPENFIENIPDVIGVSSEYGGSSAASQYYINFDAVAPDGELPSYITKW